MKYPTFPGLRAFAVCSTLAMSAMASPAHAADLNADAKPHQNAWRTNTESGPTASSSVGNGSVSSTVTTQGAGKSSTGESNTSASAGSVGPQGSSVSVGSSGPGSATVTSSGSGPQRSTVTSGESGVTATTNGSNTDSGCRIMQCSPSSNVTSGPEGLAGTTSLPGGSSVTVQSGNGRASSSAATASSGSAGTDSSSVSASSSSGSGSAAVAGTAPGEECAIVCEPGDAGSNRFRQQNRPQSGQPNEWPNGSRQQGR